LSEFVMPGLVPGIHVLTGRGKKGVDGRVKPGHDKRENRLRVVSEERAKAARLEPCGRGYDSSQQQMR
jgi:hypothetical protein